MGASTLGKEAPPLGGFRPGVSLLGLTAPFLLMLFDMISFPRLALQQLSFDHTVSIKEFYEMVVIWPEYSTF